MERAEIISISSETIKAELTYTEVMLDIAGRDYFRKMNVRCTNKASGFAQLLSPGQQIFIIYPGERWVNDKVCFFMNPETTFDKVGRMFNNFRCYKVFGVNVANKKMV
jgi:hypothetical protein